MFDTTSSYYLQLMGRPCTGEAHLTPAQPIGEQVFLQSGAITDEQDGLGLTNRSVLPLPASLLQGGWLIEAYALHDPSGGAPVHYLTLTEALLLKQPRLPLIPPGALQPALHDQPVFHHWLMERNPCPGWAERVHIYQHPGKPFEASAILYLNPAQQIAAAELFQAPLVHIDGSHGLARRIWVHFTDYPDS